MVNCIENSNGLFHFFLGNHFIFLLQTFVGRTNAKNMLYEFLEIKDK